MATIIVTDPGSGNDLQPNLQTAVTASSHGDTLVLPAGSYLYNSVITTTKKISLYSTGCDIARSDSTPDATVLGWGAMFIYNINSRDSTGIVVQGISFMSKTPSITPGDGGSTVADYLLKFICATDFIVTNCAFYYAGNAGIYVQHYDDVSRGLIYDNDFQRCKGYDGLGLGYGVVIVGLNLQWTTEVQFGSSNFIFIENNTFNGWRHAISSGGCARYVARYNTIQNNLIGQGLDAHERLSFTGTNKYAARATELYSNTLTNTTFKITQLADTAARTAFAPYSVGDHYMIQLDQTTTPPNYGAYVSTGTSAGNWTAATLPIPSPLGPPIIVGKNAQQLSNNSTLIRGGEAVVYDNTITGFRFGVGLIDFTILEPGYPILYSPGYRSGLAWGSADTLNTGSHCDGDLYVWNNTFTPYVDVSHNSVAFWNYDTVNFVEDRDYHLSAKPGYVPFMYPHPNRITNKSPRVFSSGRVFG